MHAPSDSESHAGTPLVSVVIPTYNRADTILPALLSVQRQTVQDFECIVVDDGSKDVDALEALVAGLDQRFRVVRKENDGASAARNLGMSLAQGRYIALLDSDDQFLPDKLERQLAAVAPHGDRPVLCYTQLLVDRGIGKYWTKPPRAPREGERIDEYLMADAGWIQTSTMLLTATLAKSVQFGVGLPSSQDTDFAIRCANAGAEVVFVQQPLLIMNDEYHPGRVSKQRNYRPLLAWIETMREAGSISNRSYWAYRGWQGARVASYTSIPAALGLYLASALRGVYAPRVAATILAQIVMPQSLYQRIATSVVRLAGRG